VRILLVCPARAGTLHGNRITALRWARVLRATGSRVTIARCFTGQAADLLIALHARRSAPSIDAFHRAHPERPIVVALTGTDVYRDLPGSLRARRSLETADRIVVLQPFAVRALPRAVRKKARVIYQSTERARRPRVASTSRFEVLVVAHLRGIKDPLRAALAARRLPERSRIAITHFGRAMTASLLRRASGENARNPRYRWVGERPRREVLKRLRCARLLLSTSLAEGGANAVSEAIVAGTPVIASRIAGSVGLLGEHYPGYFRPGDTASLARLLVRAELDRTFYRRLRRDCARLAPLFAPARERSAWRRLLGELRRNGDALRKPEGPDNRTSRRRRRERGAARSLPRR
jgi:putative glycosyltransferase (TIGR04348 family)